MRPQQPSPPRLVQQNEAVYSEEARRARLQGAVVLDVVVAEDGRAQAIRIRKSLGLGLDENAVAAVARWRFDPAMQNGRAVAMPSTIEVVFRVMGDARSWHLERMVFDVPPDAVRPVLVRAPYPAGGVDTDGAVSVSFDVNEQGVPGNIHVESSSSPEVVDEVVALIQEWRFQAAMRNAIPIPVHAYLDFARGDGLAAAKPMAAPRK